MYMRETGVISSMRKRITLEGAGALYERYLALKQELEDMGMFAQEYKQPIPILSDVWVVTAPTGAAVQDIRNIASEGIPICRLSSIRHLYRGQVRQRAL